MFGNDSYFDVPYQTEIDSQERRNRKGRSSGLRGKLLGLVASTGIALCGNTAYHNPGFFVIEGVALAHLFKGKSEGEEDNYY